MNFAAKLEQADLARLRQQVDGMTRTQVETTLSRTELLFQDFLTLLSPAAQSYLEPMAQRAHNLTVRRFGRAILLYAPLYISNECTNSCAYCGFNLHQSLPRVTLNLDECIAEARYLKQHNFGHLLLVCGEAPDIVPPSFLIKVLEALRGDFPSLALEVYPLSSPVYAQLVEAGADGLTLYQETYQRDAYSLVHPAGQKRNFDWRLGAPVRAGSAGFRRLGIGALLGLYDWRYEALALALHAEYLMQHFWKSQITISLPRLRHTPVGFRVPAPVADAELAQMLLALRLYLPDAGLILSTREPAQLRNNLIPLGITQMSAGSRTEPGGYLHPAEDRGQFMVEDHRTPEEVAQAIKSAGYEPVWKDWDQLLHEGSTHAHYRQRNAEGSL